jgi:AraC-like DNA-binding protein
LAKIAVDLDRALARRREYGTVGQTIPADLHRGDGWTVADVVCTSGPRDRPFEERHERYSIAIVLAGSFQYRSPLGRGLMTPGSLMLGNHGHCFECGHEHGEGDRCVCFWYAPEYFELLAADAGVHRQRMGFRVPRLPAFGQLSALVARAGVGVTGSDVAWEELGTRLAVAAMRLSAGTSCEPLTLPLNAEARVTRTIRTIDRHPAASLTLDALAREAGLSRYHFLRTFERLTGVTPHQYVRRSRLREAAMRLVAESGTILDIALDCGFGDVSSFNRAFRTEFRETPRTWRRALPELLSDDRPSRERAE